MAFSRPASGHTKKRNKKKMEKIGKKGSKKNRKKRNKKIGKKIKILVLNLDLLLNYEHHSCFPHLLYYDLLQLQIWFVLVL